MNNPVVSAPPFRLKWWPILIAAAMGLGLQFLASTGASLTILRLHRQVLSGGSPSWLFIYLQHGYALLLTLACIAALKRWWVPADYGLHWPRGKTYIGPAVLWGLLFGVLMTLVDYAPQLLWGTRPDIGFPLTRSNVWSCIVFSGVFVGPTEEIPFRALLVSFLAATMPGKLRLGRFEMNGAGVIVALLFALAHMASFWTQPWPLALGQQLYAVALGVLYAYWLEKSGSIVAPIIGHNVSDVTEYLITLAWLGVF
ncbi:CPBP family intramembrane glutamic endopeptidase [Rhodanobacter sp. DHG33]|uniref:CPBP family intramembrane glutamic endopeptidase n=1 Tax=Rhodanobacter sp. DHG33 TaxID=2775921 RepID=UPI00177DA201|nr:CPBP family intramembrane glutamic endopeptidase [Rhodanobacter sp. DHG33]MBD8899546.1 CPBP family intramembrane metalloprotease [Rhodanobacter sp. DHG33]